MADDETQNETEEAPVEPDAEVAQPETPGAEPSEVEETEVAPEPVAAEEPVAEEAAEEPAAEEPVAEEAAEEPAAEAEPAEEAEAPAEEPVAEEAADAPNAEAAPAEPQPEPAAAPEPKRKRKHLPRALRHKHSKPARDVSAARKPIIRTPKPESELGRRQERRGVVVSDKGDKSIVVKVETIRAHPRYKKVVRRSRRLHAHDEQNSAAVGDIVRIVETRPISKTKNWRLAEIVEKAR